MNPEVVEKFGNRIRQRVCGIAFRDEDILLINHAGLYKHDFWAPPGGAVEFGETMETALKREFVEECQSEITVEGFLFGGEFVRPPLHAVELYFQVKLLNMPRVGRDPEMGKTPILSALEFITPRRLAEMPAHHRHGIFEKARSPSEIKNLKGFFTIT
jgi:8-oxo-dGTP diphosphatase